MSECLSQRPPHTLDQQPQDEEDRGCRGERLRDRDQRPADLGQEPADYANNLTVVVNTQHPYFRGLPGSGVLPYLRHCIYDALAEWNLTRRVGEIP